jgi:hypothetical protein
MAKDEKAPLSGTGHSLLLAVENEQQRMHDDWMAASNDALIFGTGFLKVDRDGRVRYASIDEVYKDAEFIRENPSRS